MARVSKAFAVWCRWGKRLVEKNSRNKTKGMLRKILSTALLKVGLFNQSVSTAYDTDVY